MQMPFRAVTRVKEQKQNLWILCTTAARIAPSCGYTVLHHCYTFAAALHKKNQMCICCVPDFWLSLLMPQFALLLLTHSGIPLFIVCGGKVLHKELFCPIFLFSLPFFSPFFVVDYLFLLSSQSLLYSALQSLLLALQLVWFCVIGKSVWLGEECDWCGFV